MSNSPKFKSFCFFRSIVIGAKIIGFVLIFCRILLFSYLIHASNDDLFVHIDDGYFTSYIKTTRENVYKSLRMIAIVITILTFISTISLLFGVFMKKPKHILLHLVMERIYIGFTIIIISATLTRFFVQYENASANWMFYCFAILYVVILTYFYWICLILHTKWNTYQGDEDIEK